MLNFLESLLLGDIFNTRIKVLFINYADNPVIEEAELEQQYLPESIQPPLLIFVNNMEWLLVRASPEHAAQYSFDKKLTVWLSNPRVIPFSKQNSHPAEKNILFDSKPVQ